MPNVPPSGWCPLCRSFVRFERVKQRPRARCPRCRARERERVLAYLLDRLSPVVATAGPVLDVASNEATRRFLKRIVPGVYVGMDRGPKRSANLLASLTRLPFPDGTFGVVVCYHVLEHIPRDDLAIAELGRVLAPGGLALIQVPVSQDPTTDEDPDAPEAERIRRFGQADHVRFYGQDFDDRLRRGGLEPTRIRPRDLVPRAQAELMSFDDRLIWLCRPGNGRALPASLGGEVVGQLQVPRARGPLWTAQRALRTSLRERAVRVVQARRR